jgi:ketol-acid reductoisomerase
MQIYLDQDADLSLITGRKVAVLGYGGQGHAHALNLRDSGVSEIVVALRPESLSTARAHDAGFEVVSNQEAAEWADLVMLLAPDEQHDRIYADDLAPYLKQGAALAFGHGLSIHFKLIEPRPDLDVILIAPKGAGYGVRNHFVNGSGVPCLIGVAQDATGHAKQLAIAYAAAIGGGRSGIIETSFGEECETDLFGEQAVLCGGITHLITAGFETLVEAGYAPELAYFECLHETKLIVDLIYARGIARMRESISNTAEFGDLLTGPRIITDETRAEMRRVLADVQSGDFVRRLMQDTHAGQPALRASRTKAAEHLIETVGAEVRKLIPDIPKSA